MSEVNDILKKVTASIEEATGKFNAKAEDALKEAKKSGKLSEETKAAVDKMASEFNALREAEKTLKAAMGELEQHVAQMPLANAKQVVESVGHQVISAEALKTFASSVEGGKRISIPVKAALTSVDVPDGVVEPQRLPGIDTAPKQRLFIRDLIAPGRTSSSAIFWVQQTGFTNNAKVVPENTQKPYSEIEFTPKITGVSTIAHLFKASKQILDDLQKSRKFSSVMVPAFIFMASFLRLQRLIRHSLSNSRTGLTICVWQCCRRSWRASRHPVTFFTSLTGRGSS